MEAARSAFLTVTPIPATITENRGKDEQVTPQVDLNGLQGRPGGLAYALEPSPCVHQHLSPWR